MAAPLRVTRMLWWFITVTGFLTFAQSQQKVLIVGPSGADFLEVSETLIEELGTDFMTVYRRVESHTSFERFEQHMQETKPDLVVLMDNPSVIQFKHYQEKYGQAAPPAIAVMALFIENNLQNLQNVAGIRYEVPAVTSFTSLRNLIKKPVNRIGVIYRQSVEPFIERQKRLCQREQLELVGYPLPDREINFKRSLRRALNHLILKERVDALWILNDSALLNLVAVRDVWIPKLKRFRKPVIVGVRPLIEDWELGNFAVLPDHQGLGKQVSELVYDMTAEDWQGGEPLIIDPTSSFSILKVKYAERYLNLVRDRLGQVDVILQK